jgi:lipopolysaccharide transport system permease protein
MQEILNLKTNFESLFNLIRLCKRNKFLIWEMAKRDILDRYAGQFFGLFWTFANPLILIFIYVFVFYGVLHLGANTKGPENYTLALLSGLIPWLGFSETLIKSCYVIVVNTNLVKQVVFPIEILPIKQVLATIFTQLVLFLGLMIYIVLSGQRVYSTIFLLPLLILLQGFAMLGVSYLLSAMTVFFRDTKDIVSVFVTAVFFVSPIIVQIENVPAKFQWIYTVNPFTYMILCYRDILSFGALNHIIAWIIFPVLSILILIFGYRFFAKFKHMFSDTL